MAFCNLEAAMVIIDNETGEIKSVMGGRSTKVRRGLNRATQSQRQPGSAIKPLVFIRLLLIMATLLAL